MGWDRKRRGAKRGYFYTSVRTPTGVKKVYHGRGAAGHEAADDIEQRRYNRSIAKKFIYDEQQAIVDAERFAEELFVWAKALSAAWLVLTGHYYRAGEWRCSHGS